MSIDGIKQKRQAGRGSYSHALIKPRQYAQMTVPPAHIAAKSIDDVPKKPKLRRALPAHKPALPRQARSAVLIRRTFTPKPKKRRNLLAFMPAKTIILSIVLSINALLVGYMTFYNNPEPNIPVASTASVLGTSEQDTEGLVPSEAAVTQEAIADYNVAPDLPKELEIPRLQVLARIVRTPVRPDNKLGLPENIFDVGWHEASAKPDEMGAVLLHGHVTGAQELGVFGRIGSLQLNDTIIIRRGDDTMFTYFVTSIERVDREKLNINDAATISEEGANNGLTLVSHSSRFDVRTNKYEQRLVVKAVQR